MNLKKIVTVATALIAVVLLAGFWWLSQYDYNRIKPLIAEQVRAATAREIDIDGDLRLKIRLAPTLMTGPIRLRNAAWGSEPDMLTAEALEIQIGLLGLLRNKGVFKRLVLIKPVVLVEQSADGTQSNWEFDTPPAKDNPPLRKQHPNPLELALVYGEIKDGQAASFEPPHRRVHQPPINNFVWKNIVVPCP